MSVYGTEPKTVLNLLADVYWGNFVLNYAENDSVLDLSFDGLEEMEYLDVKDYLESYVPFPPPVLQQIPDILLPRPQNSLRLP